VESFQYRKPAAGSGRRGRRFALPAIFQARFASHDDAIVPGQSRSAFRALD
jgi:hypothetical protein